MVTGLTAVLPQPRQRGDRVERSGAIWRRGEQQQTNTGNILAPRLAAALKHQRFRLVQCCRQFGQMNFENQSGGINLHHVLCFAEFYTYFLLGLGIFGHIFRQKLAFPYYFEVASINQGVSITCDFIILPQKRHCSEGLSTSTQLLLYASRPNPDVQ